MTGDHKITEEVGIELGNAIVKTLGLESSSQVNPDNLVRSELITVEAENPGINIENIRQLPELSSAAVNAELQKQFQTLNESSKALIVSSLNDLKQFFRRKGQSSLRALKISYFFRSGCNKPGRHKATSLVTNLPVVCFQR